MYRERLTITLEAELVAAADSLIDKSTIRNRSHAIEHLVKEGLGLHLLRQAFVFVEEEGWEQLRTEAALRLCWQSGIRELFLCLPSAAQSLRVDTEALAASVGPFTITSVPADFGSGGALVLQRTMLNNPFLLLWIGRTTVLPRSLIPAFVAHRQQRGLLTQLLCSNDGGSYADSRLAIAQPDLVQHVPAGIVHLERTVFPELLKTGKITPYAFHTP